MAGSRLGKKNHANTYTGERERDFTQCQQKGSARIGLPLVVLLFALFFYNKSSAYLCAQPDEGINHYKRTLKVESYAKKVESNVGK